jgi:hypothetical protein
MNLLFGRENYPRNVDIVLSKNYSKNSSDSFGLSIGFGVALIVPVHVNM